IKKELKNLLISLKEEDFYNNVNLHIHSCESDGKLTPYEIVEQAKKAGKKYISICDHNTIEAYLSTNILREEMVIPAVEFDCYYKGVLIHILGYGINIDDEGMKSLYSKSEAGRKFTLYRLFNLRNPKEVIEKINNAGGIAVLAHPACYWCFDIDAFVKGLINLKLEGIEVYYPYNGLRRFVKFHSKKEIAAIAEKYNLIKTGGSDLHGKKLL
ncbi:MAG: PHP domain-containing protein, partial [Candidatus Gastranaerophilales bacterium]|nr:PHP domain-containing protein [Candidatus Gastranaerophilales bacterium]